MSETKKSCSSCGSNNLMTVRCRIWRMRGGLTCRCRLRSPHQLWEIGPGQFCVVDDIIQWAKLQNLSFNSNAQSHGHLSSSPGSFPTSQAPIFAAYERCVRLYRHFLGWLCCSLDYKDLTSSRRHQFEPSLNGGDSGASS